MSLDPFEDESCFHRPLAITAKTNKGLRTPGWESPLLMTLKRLSIPATFFFPRLWTKHIWVWDSKVILKWLLGFYFLLSILVFSQLPCSSLWEKGVSNSTSPWDCRGGTVSGSTGAARTQSPCLPPRDGPSARLPLRQQECGMHLSWIPHEEEWLLKSWQTTCSGKELPLAWIENNPSVYWGAEFIEEQWRSAASRPRRQSDSGYTEK